MNREAFIRQLEYLLQDISEEDRSEAMDYYLDYLDEAGLENEEAVLKEFGSPERIAAIIRASLAGDLEDGGSFTESGYEDERFRDPSYQVAKRLELPEKWNTANEANDSGSTRNAGWKEEKKPWTNGIFKLVLGVILVLAALPFAAGIGGTTLGILAAGIAIGAVLLLLAGLLTLALLVGGAGLVIAGIAAMMTDFLSAVVLIGIGFLCIGLGVLAFMFSKWFYGKVIPRIFRWIGNGLETVSSWTRRKCA